MDDEQQISKRWQSSLQLSRRLRHLPDTLTTLFARLKMCVHYLWKQSHQRLQPRKGVVFPNQVTVLSRKVIIETTMTDDLNQWLCQTSMTFICINLLADSIQPVVTLYCFHIFPIYWLVGGFKYFLFSPLLGKIPILNNQISDGLKPPTSWVWLPFPGGKWSFRLGFPQLKVFHSSGGHDCILGGGRKQNIYIYIYNITVYNMYIY